MENISSTRRWGPRKYWYIGSHTILAHSVILRTSSSYFSDVALSFGLLYSTSNKLQFQVLTSSFGTQKRFVFLALDSVNPFCSDVFQNPDILVTVAKVHHLMVPIHGGLHLSIWKSCGWASFRKISGEEGNGGGKECKGCMSSLRWVESRMRWRFSCRYKYEFMEKERCFRGWSLQNRTNSWEEQ